MRVKIMYNKTPFVMISVLILISCAYAFEYNNPTIPRIEKTNLDIATAVNYTNVNVNDSNYLDGYSSEDFVLKTGDTMTGSLILPELNFTNRYINVDTWAVLGYNQLVIKLENPTSPYPDFNLNLYSDGVSAMIYPSRTSAPSSFLLGNPSNENYQYDYLGIRTGGSVKIGTTTITDGLVTNTDGQISFDDNNIITTGNVRSGQLWITNNSNLAFVVQSDAPTDIFIVDTITPAVRVYSDLIVEEDVIANKFIGDGSQLTNLKIYNSTYDSTYNASYDRAVRNATEGGYQIYADRYMSNKSLMFIENRNTSTAIGKTYINNTIIMGATPSSGTALLISNDMNLLGTSTAGFSSTLLFGERIDNNFRFAHVSGVAPLGGSIWGRYMNNTFRGNGNSLHGAYNLIGDHTENLYTGSYGVTSGGINFAPTRTYTYFKNFSTTASANLVLNDYLLEFSGGSNSVAGINYWTGMKYEFKISDNSSIQLPTIMDLVFSSENANAQITKNVKGLNVQLSGLNNRTRGNVTAYTALIYNNNQSERAIGYWANVYGNNNSNWAFYTEAGDSLFKNTQVNGTFNLNNNANISGNVNVSGNFYVEKNVSFIVPYGQYADMNTETVASANTGYAFKFNQTEDDWMINKSIDGMNFSVMIPGDYEIILSVTTESSSANQVAYVWFEKNGVNVPRSATPYQFKATNAIALIPVSFIIDLNTTDKLRIMYGADSTSVIFPYLTNTSFSPEVPSVIMSMKYIGRITP